MTGMPKTKVRKLNDVLRLVAGVQPGFNYSFGESDKLVVFGPYELSRKDLHDVRTHLEHEYGIKFAHSTFGHTDAEARKKIMEARK
jgi:hypothetical protein